jgi:hypothetical protein
MLSLTYIDNFIGETREAEFGHNTVSILCLASVFFTFLTKDPTNNWYIFLSIAVFVVLCNIPFTLIQRFNRNRLLKLRELFIKYGKEPEFQKMLNSPRILFEIVLFNVPVVSIKKEKINKNKNKNQK